jgi:hypothetical protein
MACSPSPWEPQGFWNLRASTVGEVLVGVVRNVSSTATALLESHPQRLRRAVLLTGAILALEEAQSDAGSE